MLYYDARDFNTREAKRRLEDIRPDEVSLVERPATGKAFFFFKNEVPEMDDEMKQAIELFIGEELSDENIEDIQKAQLKPEAISGLKNALKILNQYKSDLPDDLVEAIGELAKFLASSASKPGYGYPAKKGNDDEMDPKDSKEITAAVKKAIAKMEAAHEDGKKELRALLPGEIRKDAEEDDRWTKLEASLAEIKNKIEKLETAAPDADPDTEPDAEPDATTTEEPLEAVSKALSALAKAAEIQKAETEKLKKSVAPKQSKDNDPDEGMKKDEPEVDIWKSIDLS